MAKVLMTRCYGVEILVVRVRINQKPTLGEYASPDGKPKHSPSDEPLSRFPFGTFLLFIHKGQRPEYQ